MAEITEFRLKSADLSYTCQNLSRPECIIAQPDGTLWVSDRRAWVFRRDANGLSQIFGNPAGEPNGMALSRDGSLYIADCELNKLYRLAADGSRAIVLDSFENRPLGTVNFPYFDAVGRLWLTISTMTVPRAAALSEPTPDGAILLLDLTTMRPTIAATGLCFTNEIRLDQACEWLYVVETMAGRISRYRLGIGGSLTDRETFGPAPIFNGAMIDGIALDSQGNLWLTELTRNLIGLITPSGRFHRVFEDPSGQLLSNPTSLTFAGPDLCTVYVGTLDMDTLPTFRSPIPGLPMYHWT